MIESFRRKREEADESKQVIYDLEVRIGLLRDQVETMEDERNRGQRYQTHLVKEVEEKQSTISVLKEELATKHRRIASLIDKHNESKEEHEPTRRESSKYYGI